VNWKEAKRIVLEVHPDARVVQYRNRKYPFTVMAHIDGGKLEPIGMNSKTQSEAWRSARDRI